MTPTERIVVARSGGPSVLQLKSAALPAPGPAEIQVRVEAAGVAFADVMVREGLYPGVKLPATPGYDLVGRIAQVGSGVDALQVGQRIGALTVTGGYARHINIPSAWAAPIPDTLPAAQAVALILNYVTAFQMMSRNTALQPGDVALVHGGGGGVGTALLDLCRHRGVRAFATASIGKHDLVARHGGVPIDYRREDFVRLIRQETPHQGVDAAFDHLGGVHLKRSYAALRPTGVLVSYGALAAFAGGRASVAEGLRLLWGQPRFAPLDLLSANKAVVGFDIAGRRNARPDWFAADLAELVALAAAGTIRPIVDMVVPLASAHEAHTRIGQGEARGKIVLDCA